MCTQNIILWNRHRNKGGKHAAKMRLANTETHQDLHQYIILLFQLTGLASFHGLTGCCISNVVNCPQMYKSQTGLTPDTGAGR